MRKFVRMKKFALFISLIVCGMLHAQQAVSPVFGASDERGGIRQDRIRLRGYIGYGYNYTWGSYADFDIVSRIPLNPNFEMDAGVQLSTANVYTLSFDARPKFALPVGEMYLDTRLLYKIVVRDGVHDVGASFGLGYRMDYVDVQLGAFTRFMNEFKRPWHSENEIAGEPISMHYSVEVFVRPRTSIWNLSMRIANYDDFQLERVWQPLFMIGGRYRPISHLDVLAEVEIKPTGMFHLNASFYGVKGRVGVAWEF